jgi:2',3'-cyclic-nucleotide 2'-phosphodiesterase (5'-nucleotidase family)
LCANCPETGLPATAMIPTEAGDVGFVGLTCPHPEAYASAPPLDPDLAGVVVRHSGELRASGAQRVVALIHDGVGWSIGPRGYVADPERFAALCRPWAWSVDAIVGTHTLGRWIGSVERTPVVQPWPLGAELGVVEFARGGKARAYGITPETGGRWTGAGSGLLDEASSTVLGTLEDPLHARSDGPSPLVDFFAKALREAAGTDAAAVDMVGVQPPMDGVLAYLPAGPVTEADLVRVYPWPDATVAGELGREEIRAVARSGWPEAWAAWGIDAVELADRGSSVLAVPEGDAADHVERVLGRRVHWQRTGIGLREAVRKALR